MVLNATPYERERRDRITAAVVTGYLASYANSTVDIGQHGLPSPDRVAEVVVIYADAIIKELNK